MSNNELVAVAMVWAVATCALGVVAEISMHRRSERSWLYVTLFLTVATLGIGAAGIAAYKVARTLVRAWRRLTGG